ncbi:MAG: DUF5685 family protein [Eubacteriales bacterium]|nr:DUF5685 family protein [Eubacteriales bacterium]
MFGYTKPLFPEAAKESLKLYQEYYCGLCFELGKIGKLPYRLLLSYDLCFMAIFFSALDDDPGILLNPHCPLPKLKRGRGRSSRFVRLAAKLSALLYAAKFSDDYADGQKFKARIGNFILQAHLEEVAKEWPEASELIASYPAKPPVKDLPNSFGKLLGDLFGLSAKLLPKPGFGHFRDIYESGYDPLYEASVRIGEELGRWVTILDAVDDYQQDLRAGKDNYLNYLALPERQNLAEELSAIEDRIRRHAALLPYRQSLNLIQDLILYSIPRTRLELLAKKLPEVVQ